MTEDRPSSDNDAGTGGDDALASEYTPQAGAPIPSEGVEAPVPSRRDLAIGLTATIATGDFDTEGVLRDGR